MWIKTAYYWDAYNTSALEKIDIGEHCVSSYFTKKGDDSPFYATQDYAYIYAVWREDGLDALLELGRYPTFEEAAEVYEELLQAIARQDQLFYMPKPKSGEDPADTSAWARKMEKENDWVWR